jgi:hypothetical protein
MPDATQEAWGKNAGEMAGRHDDAIDRRLNTAGDRAADPEFEAEGVSSEEDCKHNGEVKQGEDNNRGEDCDDSAPMPSRMLANVLGEGSDIGANVDAGLERTSTSSAESAAEGKVLHFDSRENEDIPRKKLEKSASPESSLPKLKSWEADLFLEPRPQASRFWGLDRPATSIGESRREGFRDKEGTILGSRPSLSILATLNIRSNNSLRFDFFQQRTHAPCA